MSSDGYFDDDDFDISALKQIDAIEAAHLSPKKQAPPVPRNIPASSAAQSKGRQPLADDDSFYDLSFEADETELAKLDVFIKDAYAGKAPPVAGPSKISRTSSSNKLQTTLFGDILPPSAPSTTNSKPKSQIERTKSSARSLFGQQAPKTKTWDQTAFAKTGIRKSLPNAKCKGKGKANDDDEEEVEFEQFPAPFVPSEFAFSFI